jgi:hypothetical protein
MRVYSCRYHGASTPIFSLEDEDVCYVFCMHFLDLTRSAVLDGRFRTTSAVLVSHAAEACSLSIKRSTGDPQADSTLTLVLKYNLQSGRDH